MLNGEKKIERPLRWGIVGGGRTGQVGYKHRTGALRDNTTYQLLAAAFDVDYERCKDFGKNLGVAEERLYPDYKAMFEAEAKRPDGIEVVSIATPNFTHFEITKAALNAGLHVICEKPLFFTVEEGEEIKKLAEEKGKIVGVTYGFSGFQMLLQMRSMIQNGDLGQIHMIELSYTHGFACSEIGDQKNEAQKWRVDPKKSGPSFVLGDLSTHTFYMSQLICPDIKLKEVLCDRQSFVKSRAPLEDNAYVLMHYDNGAVGRMWVSAVDAGSMDSQHIRIVGSKASVEFNDWQSNELIYEVQGQPNQKLYRGMPYLSDDCNEFERMNGLHTEGLGESWANIYLKIAMAIDAKNRGDEEALKKINYPDINAGIDGIRWITKCVESADKGGVWVPFE